MSYELLDEKLRWSQIGKNWGRIKCKYLSICIRAF
jgi:hypothetical protein